MYEMYTFVNNQIIAEYTKETLVDNYKKILIAIMPVLPHFSEECLSIIGDDKIKSWPSYDETKFEDDQVKIVVQINGKKRGLLISEKNTEENIIIEKINKNEKLNKYILNKNIKKKIFIKNKLINIILANE